MADTAVAITAGTGTNIDTRTEGTNGNHRQVVVIGDPATNAGVAPVDATAGLKVDLGSDNDITGTVTANLSATDNAVLDSIDAAVNGTLTVGSHAVTNAGTFATQVTSLPASTNTIEVVGDAAENAAAAGNPVLTGGRYDSTPRTLGDGDVGAIALDADGAVQISDGGNSITVDGSLTVDLGANNDVTVTSGTVTANLGATDNAVLDSIDTATNATKTALETAGGLVVNLGANNDVTVTGTVDLGATDNAVLDSIAASLAGTLTVTGGGGGTEYTEDDAAAANPVGTTLQLIRDDARGGSLTTADGDNVALRGNNKGEAYVKATDTDALLTTIDTDTGNIATGITTIIGHVDGLETLIGTTNTTLTTIDGRVDGIEALLTTIDADTSNLAVVGGGTEATALRVTIANNSTGVLSIDDNGSTVSIDDGGGVITVDGTVAVTNSDITSIKTAVEILDNATYVDDADWTADTSSHNLVGAVTQVATTANTDGDTTPLTTNAFRELRVAIPESDLATAGTAHVKKYYTNAGAVTDGIVWSPAAGKRWYVTDLIVNVSAAATVTFEDDKAGGDEAVMKFELAANSGISHTFNTPWFSGEDAADLIVTTSAGNVYITITGYEI